MTTADTVAIMQPYFFPYLGYFQLISACKVFVVYDDVNYIKQGWINRNRILLNGDAHYITLQVKGASSFVKINTIKTGDNKAKILKTVTQAYQKSPNYHNVFPLLEEIIMNPVENLATYLFHQLRAVCEYLGIETKLIFSSQLGNSNGLASVGRVQDICLTLGGSTYLNAIGGRSLYDKSEFRARGIELYFLESNLPPYKQNGVQNFAPGLSIIDVLMFNPREQAQSMLNSYNLV